MINYDIAIIGGGASGLAAAIAAAEAKPELKIVILEKLSRVGKKLLATGNGRCNFTNRNINQNCYYGSCSKVYNIMENTGIEEFFQTLGVYGYADEEGRVYPLSNSASSVLDGLRLKISQFKNIDIICDFKVITIKKEKAFRISSENNYIYARNVIAAGGGMSQQVLGSDGSILRLLKSMGITITALSPALTSFKVNPEAVRSLKGVRATAIVTLYSDKKTLGTEKGEIQFSDGIISGICIFNLSCLCSNRKNLCLGVDFLPDINFTELVDILKNIRLTRKDVAIEDFLTGLLHKRIGIFILKSVTDKALTDKVSKLNEAELKKIAAKIKNCVYDINGLSGFEKSQVTSGGVILSEINDRLESNKIKGLYFCGELLDIIGKCGGYNLAFAFASGMHAGKSCAEDLK